jgi:flagellar biosynthesis/type III secretory pathway ATPase
MQSFDFQVVLNCPLDLVFAIYTDIDRWQNRNLFGEIRWVKGRPWEEGSRLRIETRTPIRSTIDQVLQQFVRNERVIYLSHVFGITCETRVTFVRKSERETAINVAMELVGKVTRSLGFALEPLIMKSTKSFFEELQRDCEAAARKSATD